MFWTFVLPQVYFPPFKGTPYKGTAPYNTSCFELEKLDTYLLLAFLATL